MPIPGSISGFGVSEVAVSRVPVLSNPRTPMERIFDAPLWLPQPRLVKPLVHTTCFYMTIRQLLVGVSEFAVPRCICTWNSRSSDPRCAPSVLAVRAKSWSIRPQRSQDHSLNSCRGLAPFHVMAHKSPGLSARLYTG
jgi:hypothetical protein